MKEYSSEFTKNSNGEVGEIRHYLLKSGENASSLPANAPVGSDALSEDGNAYIKFENGWKEI